MSLFLQFTKVINVFYFFNMLLQFNPSISTNKPQFIAMVLVTLILIGMIKEFVADFKRYRTDRASNSAPTQLITGKLAANDVKSQTNS